MDDLVLKPSRFRALLMLALAGLLVYLEIALPGDSRKVSTTLFLALLIVVVVVVFVLPLWPGSAHLRLTSEGFEVRYLWRSRLHRWVDVEGISTYRTRIGRQVKVRMRGRALAVRFPDTYGMRASKLAALLEQWRAQAAMAGPTPWASPGPAPF